MTVLREALPAWRKANGLTQKELAERAGCSPTLIALIETGERQPGLMNAIAIAKALGIPLGAIAQVHVDLAAAVPTEAVA